MLRPAELLIPLGGAGVMLLVLGPTVRGVVGALLAAAAGLAVLLRPSAGSRTEPPPIRVLERLQLGPRVTVVLVETGGRRYLVTAGASVTQLPLEESR
jgi:flagellar biogenesis protein FliO